jgi:FkbM family methyltransferase
MNRGWLFRGILAVNTLFSCMKDAAKRRIFSRPISVMGFVAIPRRVLDRYPAAAFLERLFGLLEIDCVLDVGANLGQYHDFLRHEVGYAGRIISFEPIRSHVDLLNKRAHLDPEWSVCGCALGRTPGRASFNIMKDTQFSSFREPDHSNTPMFNRLNVVEQRVDVEVRTLDQVLSEMETRTGSFRGIFLKLDTQGFDMEVISGAGDALSRIKALQTEVSVKTIYAGTPGYEQTIRELRSKQFELSGIYANNPSHFPHLIEFDCYMISRAALEGIRGLV